MGLTIFSIVVVIADAQDPRSLNGKSHVALTELRAWVAGLLAPAPEPDGFFVDQP